VVEIHGDAATRGR